MYNHLPFEGYSYYVDSENFYHVGALVPYGTYNYRVEVIFPVLNVVASEVVVPNVTLQDFNDWVKSTKFLIQDENDELYGLLMLLLDVGKGVVDYEMCGSDKDFIRAVSYYVAHYLEMHIKLLKDEENKMSLSPSEKSKEVAEDKRIEMIDTHFGDFKKTTWGQMYWAIYGNRAKFLVGYVPL